MGEVGLFDQRKIYILFCRGGKGARGNRFGWLEWGGFHKDVLSFISSSPGGCELMVVQDHGVEAGKAGGGVLRVQDVFSVFIGYGKFIEGGQEIGGGCGGIGSCGMREPVFKSPEGSGV